MWRITASCALGAPCSHSDKASHESITPLTLFLVPLTLCLKSYCCVGTFSAQASIILELGFHRRWQSITNTHRHLLLVGEGDPRLLMATSDGEFELWRPCLSPVELHGSRDCSNIRVLNVSLLCKSPGWAPDLPDPLLVSPSVSTRQGGGVKSYFRHNHILPSL